MHLVEDKMCKVEMYKSCLLSPLCQYTTEPVCKDSESRSVMDHNTVTRTFSYGAIGSRTEALEDWSTSHSSAGIRALPRVFTRIGLPDQPGEHYPNILTPDSIPQFTIPSLSVQNSCRSFDKERDEDSAKTNDGLGSSGTDLESSLSASLACSTLSSTTSSNSLTLVLSDRRAERSLSDPYSRRKSILQREASYDCSFSEDQHCLDPSSRAALSLPHLAKVTTPYGFVTLSQSPQMASEEALLCQAGLRRLNKGEETACAYSKTPLTRTVYNKGNSLYLSEDKKRVFKKSTDSQNKERSVSSEIKAASNNNTTVASSSTPKQPDGKRKKRFYNVIRKHFISRH